MSLDGLVFVLALAISASLVGQHPNAAPMTQAEYNRRVKEENQKHGWGEGSLTPGHPVPDFTLKELESDKTIRLATFAGRKPVALIFGSYTCPIFRGQFRTINYLADMYRNKVEFILVYVREAHPLDGLEVEENVEAGILLESPRTLDEKQTLASTCVRQLNVKFTTVVDDMDNKVEQLYTAWPTRLYLIGKNGNVAWKSKPGPSGFVAAELAVAIENEFER